MPGGRLRMEKLGALVSAGKLDGMEINANMQNDSLMDDVFTICER